MVTADQARAPGPPGKDRRCNSEQGRARKQRFQERLHVLHDNALHRKLRQHLPAAFNERWTRRHWMHASLFATIGALVATIVPGFAHH